MVETLAICFLCRFWTDLKAADVRKQLKYKNEAAAGRFTEVREIIEIWSLL